MNLGSMHVDVGGVIYTARRNDWDVERLHQYMPDIPIAVVQRLLNGTATVSDLFPDGSFQS